MLELPNFQIATNDSAADDACQAPAYWHCAMPVQNREPVSQDWGSLNHQLRLPGSLCFVLPGAPNDL